MSTLVQSAVQAQTHAILTELQAVEARFETLVRQQVTTLEARREARDAKKRASPRHTEASTKVLPLRQRDVVPTEKRAAVYALIDTDNRLSSYEIAEQTGYPPPTIQRYMKDWKAKQTEAACEAEQHEATNTAI